MLNVILYLKGTIDWKLTFQVDPDVTMALNFACDADLAMSRDRRSTYGSVGWAGDCLIYGQSSTIKTIMTSSCESESHAIFETAKAVKFIHSWLNCFTYVKTPSFIFNDNKSATQLLSSRNNSGLSKHFDIKLRWVTAQIENGLIKLFHIPRGKNAADILTHSLPRAPFEEMLKLLYGAHGRQTVSQMASCTDHMY